MIQQSTHQADEIFELQTYNVIRNTILCSLSRYEAFLDASGSIFALREYDIVVSSSVSHDKMYLADSEGYISIFDIKDDNNE